MGYTLAELAALSGAHTIGFQQRRDPAGGPPLLVPLTPTPNTFDQGGCAGCACMLGVMGAVPCAGCTICCLDRQHPPQPPPYRLAAAVTLPADYFNLVLNGAAAFPTDNVLTSDPTTLAAVQTFAGNQSAFFTAFAQVYIKMSAMGATFKSYGATLRSG